MVPRSRSPRLFARRIRFLPAAWAFGLGVALVGCGVDRTGLEQVTLPDDASTGPMVRGDAPADRAWVDGSGGENGDGGSGGGGNSGAGGDGGGTAIGGVGGGIIVIGTGGAGGTGGITVIGTGGITVIGTGGVTVIGTGGVTVIGTGGVTVIGTGGSAGSKDAGTSDDDAGDGSSVETPADTGGANDAGGVAGTGGGGTAGMGGAGGASSTACTPSSCASGCCDGNTCVTDLSAQQCGASGAACIACAPCNRCSGTGTCELDPTSLWDIWAVSATLTETDPSVEPPDEPNWDLASGEVGGSLPDPFVELDLLAPALTSLGHTATIVDTLAPDWSTLSPATSALLTPRMPIAAIDLMGGRPWLIVIGDDDAGVPSGETICQIGGPLVPDDFRAGGFKRSGVDSCYTASFKLSCSQ
jgi:hypothetical protein